jgi:hypothetical protein
VQSAHSRLDAARQAWLAETNTRVQDITNEFDYARRIEQLKESYGRPIVETCGLSMSAQDALDRFVELPVPSTDEDEYVFGEALDAASAAAKSGEYKTWLNTDSSEDSCQADGSDNQQDARHECDLYPGDCHIVRTPACRDVLQRAWDETAWTGSEFNAGGDCEEQDTYAWISKTRVLQDICTMAYSVPSAQRESLMDATDPYSGLTLLNDVFNGKNIDYNTKYNSKSFSELSDHEIYELAGKEHGVLGTIEFTKCSQGITYEGSTEVIPLSVLYDETLSFAPRWASMPWVRRKLERARDGRTPIKKTSREVCNSEDAEFGSFETSCRTVTEITKREDLRYGSEMNSYIRSYCGDNDRVDFFGWNVECKSGSGKKAAANVANRFFSRVDQYCQNYANRFFYESFTDQDSQAALDSLDPGELAGCLAGELGGADVEILMARQRVRIAEASLTTLNANIFLRSHHCIQKMELGDARNDLLEKQNEAAEDTKRKIADIQEKSSWIDVAVGVLTGDLVGAASAGGKAAYAEDIRELEQKHLELSNEYSEMIAAISQEEELADCWLSVDLAKQELDDRVETIRHELLGVANTLQRREQLMLRVANALRDGKATIERETERRVPSLAHHHWVTEHVEQFGEEMRWAKRLAYLAVRAVEYEFQQSLNVRSMVRDARHPNELESALLELQREQASRTINRNRPEEDMFVLSVRDDLLNPSPQSAEAGMVSDTSMQIERLRERVMAPINAVYDRNGNYLGQGLSLYLSPQDELEYRCGERLWRVAATVQGDLLGADAPNVPVFLLKQNTFKSQWCNGHGDSDSDAEDADEFQYGYVQPSAQLFRPDGSSKDGEGIDAYSWALLNAQVNTRKSAFYAAEYQEGTSEEFAGRGLYGEYLLLFPWHGLLENDFALENIEDVLLRYDYLSVSNGPSDLSFP